MPPGAGVAISLLVIAQTLQGCAAADARTSDHFEAVITIERVPPRSLLK